jgi:hypothetical protein
MNAPLLVIRRHGASVKAKPAPKAPEMSFRKSALTHEEAERDWFAGLLWKAFPDATSENELAEWAAEALTDDKRPVTPRTVRNWLRRDNSPHFRYVLRVIALVGAESVFQLLDPEARQ